MRPVSYLNCYHYRPNRHVGRSLFRDVRALVLGSTALWLVCGILTVLVMHL